MRPGFLGTSAPLAADVNLITQLAMGAALLVGAWLARKKRFLAHAICQSVVLVLNLTLIATVMWPSFSGLVLPRLTRQFAKRYYAIATAHGVLGALAEVLGLYILLVAGTNIVPHMWRFQHWKL